VHEPKISKMCAPHFCVQSTAGAHGHELMSDNDCKRAHMRGCSSDVWKGKNGPPREYIMYMKITKAQVVPYFVTSCSTALICMSHTARQNRAEQAYIHHNFTLTNVGRASVHWLLFLRMLRAHSVHCVHICNAN
jgi:hypothetical protein